MKKTEMPHLLSTGSEPYWSRENEDRKVGRVIGPARACKERAGIYYIYLINGVFICETT